MKTFIGGVLKTCMLISSVNRKNAYIFKESMHNKISNIHQIRGSYSFFDYECQNDTFRYNSKPRTLYKRQHFKQYSVEDHHIIPRRFRDHPLIEKTNYDVNCSNNILIMPSKCSQNILKSNLIMYHGTHHHYCEYVQKLLNDIHITSYVNDHKYHYYLYLLVKHLETRILVNDKTLPWD